MAAHLVFEGFWQALMGNYGLTQDSDFHIRPWRLGPFAWSAGVSHHPRGVPRSGGIFEVWHLEGRDVKGRGLVLVARSRKRAPGYIGYITLEAVLAL